MKRRWKSAVAALAAIATIGSLTGVTTYAADSVSITNVSYDPVSYTHLTLPTIA